MKNYILLYVIAFFTFYSCNSVEKIVTTEQQTKSLNLLDFHAIEVSSGLDVKMYKGKENRVTISSNILDYIKVHVNDRGELTIRKDIPKGFYLNTRKNKTYIEVWAKDVDFFEANSSADLEILDVFPAKKQTIVASSSGDVMYNVDCKILHLEATSSGDIEGEIKVKELYAKATSSGDIEINGSAQKAELMAVSSGDINAEKLAADYVLVDIQSSGDVYIDVQKEINGEVSSSGDLYYKAHGPIQFDVKQNSGGDIERIN